MQYILQSLMSYDGTGILVVSVAQCSLYKVRKKDPQIGHKTLGSHAPWVKAFAPGALE